jgi:hypothetical protein
VGRLLYIFFIPMGVSTLIFCCASRTSAHLHDLRRGSNAMGLKELLVMDGNGDNVISKAEFQLYMLRDMGKVEVPMLHILEKQFNTLDRTGDGMLTAADIPPDCAAGQVLDL